MTFLPIVARELRVASRRRATYWVRSGAALALIVVGVWFFLMMRHAPPHEVALVLFRILAGASVLYCLLSGVRATADCLSEEKREGTLGLLFLTDLKGYDVVFGKLAATSLNAFYGVLAVVPMLAVPLLMGGITLGEFGRMAIVTINTLFFSLSIGICVSAFSRSARIATGTTFFLIFVFTALLPAAGALGGFFLKIHRLETVFLMPSAGFSFYIGFDSPYKAVPRLFWWSCWVIHALGWIFLGISAFMAPRSWQDKPAGIQRLRWRERWKSWSYGNSVERYAFRTRLLDTSAFYWLAARARLKPAQVWAVLGLLACAWIWGLLKFHRDWLNSGLYFTTAFILNVLLKGWVAAEAGRQLAEDRKRGALELLLSTPLSVREILRGQRLALQRQFLGPLLTVLLIEVVLMLATAKETATQDEIGFMMKTWTAGMLMLIADVIALYWVGVWQAMISRNPNRAPSATVARVLVLPWIVFALVALVLSLTTFRTGHEPSEYFFLGLWFGVGLVADVGFGAWARHKFLSEFRVAASQQYAKRLGFWRRVFVTGQGAGSVQLRALGSVTSGE